MLGVADVCRLCGQTHPETSFSLSHGGPGDCPKVIMGSFPVLSPLDADSESSRPSRPSAGRRILEFETPVQISLGSLPATLRSELPSSGNRALAVPWLRPPDLGEVL